MLLAMVVAGALAGAGVLIIARGAVGETAPLTAIVAGSDQVAVGVYDALRELNISVPDEMSVVGINDTQGAALSPPMTSLRTFPEELGRHMAEFVLKRLQNPLIAAQELTIPTQTVLRSSVAAPVSQEASLPQA